MAFDPEINEVSLTNTTKNPDKLVLISIRHAPVHLMCTNIGHDLYGNPRELLQYDAYFAQEDKWAHHVCLSQSRCQLWEGNDFFATTRLHGKHT